MKKIILCIMLSLALFSCSTKNNTGTTVTEEPTPTPEVTTATTETPTPEVTPTPEETTTPEVSTAPVSDYKYFDTEITGASLDSIFVEFEGKEKEIVLDIEENPEPYRGFEIGMKLRIYYVGDLNNSVLSGNEIKKIEYLD